MRKIGSIRNKDIYFSKWYWLYVKQFLENYNLITFHPGLQIKKYMASPNPKFFPQKRFTPFSYEIVIIITFIKFLKQRGRYVSVLILYIRNNKLFV